eukprot:s159_g37.t2
MLLALHGVTLSGGSCPFACRVMPRPPKRCPSPEAEAYRDLPSEENAQGPRSLSPPRFFSDNRQHQSAKVGDVKPPPNHVPQDMTATARLRLDEVSRLFPEAHRPPDRRAKDSLPSFSKLNRRPSPSDGLGVRNRLANGWSSQAPSTSLQSQQMQAILCAVPRGSLGPPGICRGGEAATQVACSFPLTNGVPNPPFSPFQAENQVKKEKQNRTLPESTAKLILFAILDCLAVIGRSIFAALSFFWSMIRSCCYPVKEGFTRCVDRYKEKTPYALKKSASNVPQPLGETHYTQVVPPPGSEVQLRGTSSSPCRPRSGSDAFSNRSASPIPTTHYSVGAPVMLPSTPARPFMLQNNVGSLAKLSTVQLGGLQPMAPIPKPTCQWSAAAQPIQTTIVPKTVVVKRGRSMSPVSSPVQPTYSTAYPASPAMSPVTSFRTPMSPGISFRPTMSPGISFRPVACESYSYTVSTPWSQPSSCSPSREVKEHVAERPRSPFQSVSVKDPRLSQCPRLYRPCRPSQNINVAQRPMDFGPLKDPGVSIIQGCENAITGEPETASGSIGSGAGSGSARSARFSEDVHKAAPGQFLPETPILTPNNEADLEEAYILSAFRRRDENDMAKDGWKGVNPAETKFLDLCSHNRQHGEAKEALREAAGTAGTAGLPSIESLRATLQALRVQDRLARMEAAPVVPLVPTVPTVPTMAAMAAAMTAPAVGCQLDDDERSSDVGRASGGAELANVTNGQFHAEAQELLA